VRHGVALDVAALASQLLDSRSTGDPMQNTVVVADPRSNAILLRSSSPEKLQLARELIERIDSPESRPGNLHVVYLRNAQATRLAEVLRGALGGQSGSASQASHNGDGLGPDLLNAPATGGLGSSDPGRVSTGSGQPAA